MLYLLHKVLKGMTHANLTAWLCMSAYYDVNQLVVNCDIHGQQTRLVDQGIIFQWCAITTFQAKVNSMNGALKLNCTYQQLVQHS